MIILCFCLIVISGVTIMCQYLPRLYALYFISEEHIQFNLHPKVNPINIRVLNQSSIVNSHHVNSQHVNSHRINSHHADNHVALSSYAVRNKQIVLSSYSGNEK